MIGQLCLDVHFPERGNLYTQCEPYKPEDIQESPLSILYLFIIILMKFLKYELSIIFIVYSIYISVYSA